ncbi:MAG: aminomethyl-transferring glycine dehydrogenase subunit GcvPA [Chloroflexi bacterium]|nr:aminomethyl-transferring glycine dehydrogenase subunit GcvPA [Chloroflexota bacterium]
MAFLPLTDAGRQAMLETIGIPSVDDLFADVPEGLRFPALELPGPRSELEAREVMEALAAENRPLSELACFVGAGAYNHYVPAAVSNLMMRSEFLTSYTPYQPELSQGTLQFMFEFQSLVCDLLGMEVANASVYDGSTACAEAVLMAQRLTRRDHVVLAGDLHPEYRETIATYLRARDIKIETGRVERRNGRLELSDLSLNIDQETACVVVQQPGFFGSIGGLSALAELTHAAGALLVVAVPESVSLGLLKPPGAFGADIVVAEGQPLGIPPAFGGPWSGLMATRSAFVRQLPGRIVGETVDHTGKRGFVLTLQAREQHIRREKATSNICTSQTLLALANTIYLSLLGPSGLRSAAGLSHRAAVELAERVERLPGCAVLTPQPFFNEFVVSLPVPAADARCRLIEGGIVGGADLGQWLPGFEDCLLLCCTELNSRCQIDRLVSALAEIGGRS